MATVNPNLLRPSGGEADNRQPAKWHRRSWVRLIVIMIVIIIITVAALLTWWFFSMMNVADTGQNASANFVQNTSTEATVKSPARLLAEKTDRPHWGNDQAKLVIVEFGDFQCPHCNNEFPIVREMMNKYKNYIYFIYRQYPVINENSIIFSEASLCADEQGKFWQFHDRLYAAPEKNVADIESLALASGVDQNKFKTCLDTQKTQPAVLEDAQDATSLGVEGTPTFFINGNKLSGEVSADQWDQIIKKWQEVNK